MEKNIDELKCELESFHRAIYVHYMEYYKKTSSVKFIRDTVEFFNTIKRETRKVEPVVMKLFGRSNIYRMCDAKDEFYNEYDYKIGEVWYQGDKVSCWLIN